MNRLWVRLSLAFIVVTQLSVFVMIVLADQGVNGEFRRYVFFSGVNQTSAALVRYYNVAGSWSGVDKILAAGHESGSSGQASQPTSAQPVPVDMPFCPPLPPLMLADAQGKVVYDSQQAQVGKTVKVDEQAAAVPINSGAAAGKTLGYILPETNTPKEAGVPVQVPSAGNVLINTQEQTFLDRMHNTPLGAAL